MKRSILTHSRTLIVQIGRHDQPMKAKAQSLPPPSKKARIQYIQTRSAIEVGPTDLYRGGNVTSSKYAIFRTVSLAPFFCFCRLEGGWFSFEDVATPDAPAVIFFRFDARTGFNWALPLSRRN
jgi:hypothetical protein